VGEDDAAEPAEGLHTGTRQVNTACNQETDFERDFLRAVDLALAVADAAEELQDHNTESEKEKDCGTWNSFHQPEQQLQHYSSSCLPCTKGQAK
jgi:hypothetical protein